MIGILCALDQELAGIDMPPHFHITITGVGKINATIATLQFIQQNKPDLIINFGTAGAINPSLEGLLQCGSAVQHDFDLRPLGFPLGAMFGKNTPEIIEWDSGYRIGSGDQFVIKHPEIACDLVDMEAFAIAKVCRIHKVKFKCLKYVSDKADDTAPKNWQEEMAKGANYFAQWLGQNHP